MKFPEANGMFIREVFSLRLTRSRFLSRALKGEEIRR